MPQPSLNPRQTFATCDNNDTRSSILGTDLDPGIREGDVTAEYWKAGVKVADVDVRKARVKNSVLILKLTKIVAAKSDLIGDDEIVVVVTNPGGAPPSEPVKVPVIFE